MFGQHHDGNSQNNQGMTPADVTEDGTLGIPAPGSSIGGPISAPAAMGPSDDSSGMPALPQSFRQPATQLPAQPAAGTAPEPSMMSNSSGGGNTTAHGLISIKQEALQQLKPLVGHLDQTPEEKFRTAMMMIQAADDQSLIGEAYEAAKGIADEKVRAQALLDVVNEINYFTSQNNNQA
jgi:hypothetical protein